jgi:hypothetical protein
MCILWKRGLARTICSRPLGVYAATSRPQAGNAQKSLKLGIRSDKIKLGRAQQIKLITIIILV